VRPFRLGPAQNATVMDSVDHSHAGLARSSMFTDGLARMDGFAQTEFSGKSGPAKTPAQVARGRQYANRFTIFDNIFATEDVRQGIVTTVPAGFNTLPSTLPQYNSPAP